MTLNFLWLEITGQCNLTCQHCYADSSPRQSHGTMQAEQWEQVLTDAYQLGCRSVQFIGGEPTLYPALPRLLERAHGLGMSIEVYTNLVAIKPALWPLFQEYQVRLATSFYAANAQIHDRITQRQGSYWRTVANMKHTLEQQVPLRVGMIQMLAEQDIEEARRFLQKLGVPAERIGVDHARSVGRGQAFSQVTRPEDALCGACSRGKAAVTPDGSVYPCVFSRWLPVGNVRDTSLATIIADQPMAITRQHLSTAFAQRNHDCNPDVCSPDDCEPFCEPYDCAPDVPNCEPTTLCIPDYKPAFPPCEPDTCNPDACNPNKLPE